MTTPSPRRHAVRVRRIAAVGQTLNAAESLYRADLYGSNAILRGQAAALKAPISSIHPQVTRALDSKTAALTLHAVDLACGVSTLLFAHKRRLRAVTAAMSVVTSALGRQRNGFGRDGSDQMQRVINSYDVVSCIIPHEAAADDLFLRAVNAQLAMSYCTAGLIKLISEDWRSGRAVGLVMRTSAYGHPQLSALIDRFPVVGKMLCWQTIAWETMYPITYVLPPSAAQWAMRFAKVFHLSIGHFMGLPRFIWAFSATHPAADYVVAQRTARRAA